MKKNYKNILLALFLVFFAFLFLQQKFVFSKEKELNGAITNVNYPKLTSDTWFNQSFQNQAEKYVNQEFGYRNFFVRIYNQVAFSIYNYAKAKDVIVGKDNYMYEYNYIKAAYGYDFIGEDSIREKITKLKVLQDELKEINNTDIITVFAPGKGSYYKEYIPDRYVRTDYETNLEYYKKCFDDLDLKYIDFNTYFVEAKDTSRYPLIPKTGIHMSYYGDYIFIDSIAKYIENLRGIKLPKLHIDSVIISKPNEYSNDQLFLRDEDVEDGMNLLFNISDLTMAYPIVSVNDSNRTNIKLLAMGDSYWDAPSRNFSRRIFKDERYWFYNSFENPHVPYWNENTIVWKLNVVDILRSTDVILIVVTDASLPAFAFEFIDQNYKRVSLPRSTE